MKCHQKKKILVHNTHDMNIISSLLSSFVEGVFVVSQNKFETEYVQQVIIDRLSLHKLPKGQPL